MKIEEIISAVQATLGVTVDGRAGPETWGAIYDRIVKPSAATQPEPQTVDAADARSEKAIATLQPEVQPLARALVQKAALNGIRIRIISGLRTYAEQDALYAQGRTAPGSIVTNAKVATPITISASRLTSAYLRVQPIWATRRSTRWLAYSAWSWGWDGAATGRRWSTSRIFSFAPRGLRK